MPSAELERPDPWIEAQREIAWAEIVHIANVGWPGQELSDETRELWFEHLRSFPMAEVKAGMERCLREQEFLPSLKRLFDAMDANQAEEAAERRERAAAEARAARNRGGGASPHPETKLIRELVERSKGMPGDPDYLDPKVARQRIEQLVAEMDERVDRAKRGQLT